MLLAFQFKKKKKKIPIRLSPLTEALRVNPGGWTPRMDVFFSHKKRYGILLCRKKSTPSNRPGRRRFMESRTRVRYRSVGVAAQVLFAFFTTVS